MFGQFFAKFKLFAKKNDVEKSFKEKKSDNKDIAILIENQKILSEKIMLYEQKILDLSNELNTIKKKLSNIVLLNKELVNAYLEEQADTESEFCGIRNRIKEQEFRNKIADRREKKKIAELETKFDAVLEVISEKFAEHDDFPNLFTQDNLSIRRIWHGSKNKKDAIQYSILFLLKKMVDEKGLRIN